MKDTYAPRLSTISFRWNAWVVCSMQWMFNRSLTGTVLFRHSAKTCFVTDPTDFLSVDSKQSLFLCFWFGTTLKSLQLSRLVAARYFRELPKDALANGSRRESNVLHSPVWRIIHFKLFLGRTFAGSFGASLFPSYALLLSLISLRVYIMFLAPIERRTQVFVVEISLVYAFHCRAGYFHLLTAKLEWICSKILFFDLSHAFLTLARWRELD